MAACTRVGRVTRAKPCVCVRFSHGLRARRVTFNPLYWSASIAKPDGPGSLKLTQVLKKQEQKPDSPSHT